MAARSGERISWSVEDYVRNTAGTEGAMQIKYTALNEPVSDIVVASLRQRNRHLRHTINLSPQSFAEMSHEIAGKLAGFGDELKYAYSDKVDAAFVFWMASGAEKVAFQTLRGIGAERKRETEHASLYLIYAADALDLVSSAGYDSRTWFNRRDESFGVAFKYVTDWGRLKPEQPSRAVTETLPHRQWEAYTRSKGWFRQR